MARHVQVAERKVLFERVAMSEARLDTHDSRNLTVILVGNTLNVE